MNNVDDRGFPGTEGEDGQFDGGDTAAIIGTLMALGDPSVIQKEFPSRLSLMRDMLIRDKGPVRHPDESKWYGQPDRFSRDQLIPILCSFVAAVGGGAGHLYYFHRKNKFLRAWNTRKNGAMDVPLKPADFTGPEVWALWARVRQGPWWLKCLLLFLDLETLAGSILWRFKRKSDRVCRNHMLVCIIGMTRYPTITMRAAFHLNDWPDLIARWEGHCRDVKEYPTADLFRAAVAKF